MIIGFARRPTSRPLHGAEFLWGAHHPHCGRHSHHLIWVAGHPWCLGCACLYTGIALAVAVVPVIPWSAVGVPGWMVAHLVLVLPTVLQPRFQAKAYKMVSRLFLGLAVGSYWFSGLVFVDFWPTWSRVFVLLGPFGVILKSLSAQRARWANDPCRSCPLGVYPTCDWNMPRLLALNADPDLRAAIRTREVVDRHRA